MEMKAVNESNNQILFDTLIDFMLQQKSYYTVVSLSSSQIFFSFPDQNLIKVVRSVRSVRSEVTYLRYTAVDEQVQTQGDNLVALLFTLTPNVHLFCQASHVTNLTFSKILGQQDRMIDQCGRKYHEMNNYSTRD